MARPVSAVGPLVTPRRPRGSSARWAAIALAIVGVAAPAPGQPDDDKNKEDLSRIEPYTGPPILLPEGDAPPPPTAVETQIVKSPYKGTEILQYERGVTRYSDNSLKSNGPITEYYSSGQKFVEGRYDSGKPVGEWTYYHPNGQVAKKVPHADGKPDGKVQVFDEEGALVAVRRYTAGRRDGKWVYHKPGVEKPVREESYTEGKADGVWNVWYENGQLRQTSRFTKGKLDGTASEWSLNGDKRAEAEFKDGKRHGKTTQWTADGSVIERLYDEGQLIDRTNRTADGGS